MATLTITTTAAHEARIAKAFGAHLNLGRNATGDEVKQAVIRWVSDIVHSRERSEAEVVAAAGVGRITPT